MANDEERKLVNFLSFRDIHRSMETGHREGGSNISYPTLEPHMKHPAQRFMRILTEEKKIIK